MPVLMIFRGKYAPTTNLTTAKYGVSELTRDSLPYAEFWANISGICPLWKTFVPKVRNFRRFCMSLLLYKWFPNFAWSSFWTMQNFVNIAQGPAGIVLPWRRCIFISSYLIFSWTHIVTVFDSVTYNVLFHNPISNTVVCNSDSDYNDYLVVFKWCDVHGSHLLRLCPCHFAL